MSPRYERRQRGGGGALLLLIAAAALVVAVLAIFTDVFRQPCRHPARGRRA